LDEFVEHFSHAALLDTRLPKEGKGRRSGALVVGQALPFSAVALRRREERLTANAPPQGSAVGGTPKGGDNTEVPRDAIQARWRFFCESPRFFLFLG
jgi:hypothetical protein